MELSDLWLKMAKNESLTPQELDFLRIQGKNTQQNNALTASWVNADGTLDLIRPRISNPYFVNNALAPLIATRTTDTAITTSTDYAVPFENIAYYSNLFSIDLSDATKIKLVFVGQGFQIIGRVAWQANATGNRGVKIEAFTQDDVSLGGALLCNHQGFSGEDNVFPFSFTVPNNQFPTMSYFKLLTGHTRGADLNLLYFDVSIFSI